MTIGLALALALGACGGDDDDTSTDDDPVTTAPADDGADATTGTDGEAEEVAAEEVELDAVDGPTRFAGLDWTIVGAERRAQVTPGQTDPDPDVDHVMVALEVEDAIAEAATSELPRFDLVVDDEPIEATGAYDTSTEEQAIGVIPAGGAVTIDFSVATDDDVDGAWVRMYATSLADSTPSLPADLGGPDAVDQGERVDVTFDSTTYDGPFGQNAALIEVSQAFWSRELGADDDGVALEAPDGAGLRPADGHAWLLVQVEVTCRSAAANIGGCNVNGGIVTADDVTIDGTGLNELLDYDATGQYWLSFPVPGDAETITFGVASTSSDSGDSTTAFTVTDTAPLAEMAG